MADVSKLTIGGVTYDLKDATSREGLPIIGSGEPGALTLGKIGQIYVDSVSLRAFACVQETPSMIWKEVSNVIVLGEDDRSACLPGCAAQAEGSVALGTGTIADGTDQLAIGRNNYGLGSPYLMVVGNGASSSSPSNAAALDSDGTLRIKGEAYVGCYSDSTGGDKVATEQWVGDQGFLTDIPDGSVTSAKLNVVNFSATGTTSINRKAGTTVGSYSMAIGYDTEASGSFSFAEGSNTVAGGDNSHAEGYRAQANGTNSHAEGWSSRGLGNQSHAEGLWTIARQDCQHTQGKYNVEDVNGVYADIIGWGTGDGNRKNISALTTTGDLKLKGDVYVNCADNSTGGVLLNRVDYGSSDPTTGTAGAIGQIYVNTTSGSLFSCVGAGSPYSWINLSTGGGGMPVLSGASAPTSSTVGLLGQLYICTTDLLIYCCTMLSPYTWQLVSNREVLIEAGTTPYATISAYLDAGCVVYANEPGTGTDIYTYVCTGRHQAADQINYLDFSAVYASAGWNFKMFDCDENDTWTYGGRNWTIPYPPTVNGTYRLTCTVSGGVPTFSWST